MSETSVPTLYTLAPSHFSERARWGLDWMGIAYAEHRLALGPHALCLKAKGLPHTTLPVLADGDVLIQGSGAILDHVGLPAADQALEDRFEREVGPLVRRFIYAAAFASEAPGILDVLLEGVAPVERVAGLAAWPALSMMMRRGMGGPGCLATASDGVAQQLDWFDHLVDSRDGALAGRFGRADITAASLLYPLAGVFPTPTSLRPNYSEAVREQLADWQQRPSLRWVRRTYQLHRAATSLS